MKKTIVCLAAAAACLCLLSGCGFSLPGFSSYTYKDAARYTRGGGTVDGPVEAVDIDWVQGSVRVEYYDGDEVTVSETADKELGDKNSLYYWLDGTTLRVRFAKSGGWHSRWPYKELTVRLPEGTELTSLEAQTVSAGLSVEGAAARMARLETVSGRMDIDGCRFSYGELNTVSGALTASLTGQTEELEADTVSGTIDVTGAIRAFSADSTSGDVRLTALAAPDSLEIETVSGTVTLYLPEAAGFTLDVDTVSGGFQSALDCRMDGRGEYVFGDGRRDYEISTTSGGVRVEPAE